MWKVGGGGGGDRVCKIGDEKGEEEELRAGV